MTAVLAASWRDVTRSRCNLCEFRRTRRVTAAVQRQHLARADDGSTDNAQFAGRGEFGRRSFRDGRSRRACLRRREPPARRRSLTGAYINARYVLERSIDLVIVCPFSTLDHFRRGRRRHESNGRPRRIGAGRRGRYICQPRSGCFPPRSLRLPRLLSR